MRNVLEYLERAAKEAPEKTAVVDEYGRVDYQTLLRVSQSTGSFLLQSGIGRNRPVPVFMEKGIEALTAFFGILYAGCFYVL